jgi:polysaccharide biosynthesis protein PslH
MRILLICNKFPYPPRDGGSLASYNMTRGLVEAGNRVDLLAMNTSKHYSPEGVLNIDIDGLNKVRDVFIDNSVSYPGLLYNLLFSAAPYNAGRFIHKTFKTVLADMLQENEYDIIQMEGLYLASYIQEIRENTKAKIVYRAHNIEHEIWGGYLRNTKAISGKFYLSHQYKKIRNFEQEFVNRYDLLATVTQADLEKLNSMGNDKPAIVAPFGMYPHEFIMAKSSSAGDWFHLQYIGALDWLPNVESLNWFIDNVWVKVKKKYPGLRFSVAGRNPRENFAKKMVTKGIDFLGEVESSREYLSENGIVVVPLFSGSGIRVKIIEALFMNKPVIATSFAVSGIPVEDGVNILLADSENEFLDCIGKLITDQDYAAGIGARAGELSSRYFNNRTITEELTTFYKIHSV